MSSKAGDQGVPSAVKASVAGISAVGMGAEYSHAVYGADVPAILAGGDARVHGEPRSGDEGGRGRAEDNSLHAERGRSEEEGEEQRARSMRAGVKKSKREQGQQERDQKREAGGEARKTDAGTGGNGNRE